MYQYENMSAVHAGTKKWNKIIRGKHHEQHPAPPKTTTTSSNANLMEVFCVWCAAFCIQIVLSNLLQCIFCSI